jgi:hypothetical protein
MAGNFCMTIVNFSSKRLSRKVIYDCDGVVLRYFTALFSPMNTLLLLLCLSNGVNANQELVLKTTPVQGSVLQVRIPMDQDLTENHVSYFPQLLVLALDKTISTDGPYNISYLNEKYTTNRLIAELSKDTHLLNVMWTANSIERQEQLRPIRVSILKGLNSYRIFLIRKEDYSKFQEVNSLDDLRGFVAGQGAQWPDADVLVGNDMPLITVAQPDSLFPMLANKRFDYFPRGLYEIWSEQPNHASKGLVIEGSLLLNYPSPIYFFVNNNDIALADRIERGLAIAISDGSFDELFFSFEGFKKGWAELHGKSRKLLKLKSDFQDQD